jgi:RNA polymerase sigma-70 factor, ECF subfamily
MCAISGDPPPPPPSHGEAGGDVVLACMTRMAVRDSGGLDDFFHLCGPALMGVAMQMLGSRQDAEEVLQDTLVKLWQKAPAYDARLSRPYSWALLILRNLCIDRLRARSRQPQAVTLLPDWDAPALQGYDPAMLADMRDAWENLAPSDQAILSRAVFSADTTAAIAASNGEPVGTVKARIHRAMARFFNAITSSPSTS